MSGQPRGTATAKESLTVGGREKSVCSYPKVWPVERLRFSILSNPVRSEVGNWADDTPVSFVPMDSVGERGEIDASQERPIGDIYNGYTYFAAQDILIAKITPCFENGKGAIATELINGVGFGTTEFHVLRPLDGISARWLYYLTASDAFRKIGEAEMLGAGGQKRVPEDFVRNFKTGIPSFEEQERIAVFLDWKTAQIDALIAKKRELIQKLKENRLAVITQAVTKGLDPKVPLRDSGIPWLGKVPKHWEAIPLGFLITMSGGMTPSMANSEYWEGDIPWVTPKDMKQPRISDSLDHVTPKALAETGLSLVPVGAVLIVVRGMILAHSFPTAVTEAPVTINQDMKALRCGDHLTTEFLFWCLTGFSKVLSNMAQESAHGTRKMETDTLKKLRLSVPPIVEQQAITRHLEARLGQLDQLAMATEQTIARLTEYRSALITAATTGKIDLRGWHAEKEAA